MKRISIVSVILALAAVSAISARGQDFRNLNFDLAGNLPGNRPAGGWVSVTNALPDWTVYQGEVSLIGLIYYTGVPGADSAVELAGGDGALSGNNLTAVILPDGSISQTGSVPGDAESLRFEASIDQNDMDYLSVSLGGQSLSYSEISPGPDYIVYGANLPANMAGQTETLSFRDGQPDGSFKLDNIQFSTMAVPEPSECALFGIATILIVFFKIITAFGRTSTTKASPSRAGNSPGRPD